MLRSEKWNPAVYCNQKERKNNERRNKKKDLLSYVHSETQNNTLTFVISAERPASSSKCAEITDALAGDFAAVRSSVKK